MKKIGIGVLIIFFLFILFVFMGAANPYYEQNDILEQADRLARGYYYDKAIDVLKKNSFDNLSVDIKIKEYKNAQKSLTVYSGKIYHIFFHSLILEPKLAFSSKMKDGYNNWMTTRTEFKRILENLRKNNFILIDINSLVINNNGKIKKAALLLPKNKKPLIISVDDVNYYEYMKGSGFAEKLIVNADGDIACLVNKGNTKKRDMEGDVVPIVDNYVQNYPEFSYQGAKGIVAVTGYQGVFGYNFINAQKTQKENDIKNAMQVAAALKNNGWKIACHSYSHSVKFKDASISFEKFKTDLKNFEEKIVPIIGKTNIYISPYGINFSLTDKRMQYLSNNGYNIFCPVYKEMSVCYHQNMLISERLNFDGYTMQKAPNRIKKYFFDPALIIDRSRPSIK